MFRERYNEVRFTVRISPVHGLLVKEGRHQKEPGEEHPEPHLMFHRQVQRTPSQPRKREGSGSGSYENPKECFNMACVYSHTPQGDRFYLPGSSLRGVMRTTAERVVARWRPELVNDPFARSPDARAGTDQQLIQQRRAQKNRIPSDRIYTESLPIERCFGHTLMRGRWTIADAWMENEALAHVTVRDGVGINRTTGAAQDSLKYQYETITGGCFKTTITLINYEVWQLGLLAHVLAALDSGETRLGYGTRRGLGEVHLAVSRIEWRWYGTPPMQRDQEVIIPPMADLVPAEIAQDYRCYDNLDWPDPDQDMVLKELRLSLTPDTEALVGSIWHCTPPLVNKQGGGEGTDWSQPLWARLAACLPPALQRWNRPGQASPGDEEEQV